MKRERSPTLQRLAWEHLWRILLAPPTDAELARLRTRPDATSGDQSAGGGTGDDAHGDLYRGSA